MPTIQHREQLAFYTLPTNDSARSTTSPQPSGKRQHRVLRALCTAWLLVLMRMRMLTQGTLGLGQLQRAPIGQRVHCSTAQRRRQRVRRAAVRKRRPAQRSAEGASERRHIHIHRTQRV